MNIQKFIWYIQTRLKKVLYGHIGHASYFARGLHIIGRRKIYIGNKCRIYPNARIEVVNHGKLIVFDDVSIGQNAHIISFKGELCIGKSTTISSNVFISNVNHSYQDINISSLKQDLIYKKTVIGDYCFIGTGAVIMPGAILGKNCIVGANSIVLSGNYDDYTILAGNPARIVKKYDFIKKVWVKV